VTHLHLVPPPRVYLLDGQPGVELPMPLLAPNPHLRLEMEDDDLVVTHFTQSLGHNLGALNMGLSHHDLVIAGDEKNPVQLDFASRLGYQAFYFDDLSRGNSVLLPSGLNYSVNGFPPVRDAD
jgi:hypothetical protein